MKVGSLFSGIGGFDLGLERAGYEIAWQVEIDPYCSRVLAKHWPAVPRYGDICTMDWGNVEPVDLLCGGFPCQDLSLAGKRAGIDGARSGLWSEYVRAIRALRPRYVLVENVPGLLSNPYMGRVLADLAQSGYDAEWDCIPASAIGAPHRRDRIWITAIAADERREGWRCPADESSNSSRGEIGDNAEGVDTMVSDPLAFRCKEQWQSFSDDTRRQLGWVRTQYGTGWSSEPSVRRVVNGFPGRVDRLKGLGNSVVPQIVEALGMMIMSCERQRLPRVTEEA